MSLKYEPASEQVDPTAEEEAVCRSLLSVVLVRAP